MSIFKKVVILFIISLSLMLFVSNKTNKLTQDTLESLIKDKYVQVSKELFTYLANNDTNSLQKKLKLLEFKTIENKQHYLKSSKSIYKYSTEFSSIEILRYEDYKYLLYMKYLDDGILVIDLSQKKHHEEKEFLDFLILFDIFILVLLFLIILKIIYPLKNIAKNIKNFGDGNYKSRVEVNSKDEIGKLANTFNSMATNIEDMIISRQRLLRDIGHELKTPISKSKLALEMMENTKYKKILNKAVNQMDDMTNELLSIEKINANMYELQRNIFDVETLISEALSKLFIEDEKLIDITIDSNFKIKADLKYLTIALKNLIDNALKYSTKIPIFIIVKDKTIYIKSKGEKLTKSLDFYCETFTQEDNSREQKGYGLGLSLVKRILDKHRFELLYNHDKGYNLFSISLH